MDHASRPSTLRDRFDRLSDTLTAALGSFWALAGSVILVVVWALTGPIFHFSDTWQLFINTTTTVITFWMVFVIQSSANRSSRATQLKLDELIRALENARNEIIGLDKAPAATMVEREREFEELASTGGMRHGSQSTKGPGHGRREPGKPEHGRPAGDRQVRRTD